MRAAIKRSRFAIAAGIALGFVIWAYDYDFFLNAGGPETPISRAILRVCHLQDTGNWQVLIFSPLLVLMAGGAAAGWFLSLVLRGKRATERV
jgi:hypothetical protein